MNDWTKGGAFNRVTIYRYGTNAEQYCHLCFYNDKLCKFKKMIIEDQEFEITEMIRSLDMVCMVYPFVDKVNFLDQLNAWFENSEDCSGAQWATSATVGAEVEVNFYRSS